MIEIDGPEVPILDGSAVAFVKEILRTGIKLQNHPVKAIRILKIDYKKELAWAKLEPSENPKISFLHRQFPTVFFPHVFLICFYFFDD